MSFRINTNTAGAFSNYQLQKSSQNLSNSLQKLSSGNRINKASDDASGMVIADRLSSQSKAYGQAIKNINDTISISQIADGALGQATEILQGIRVKALQAANGSQSSESLAAIQSDIDRSLESLHGIAQNTSYNGQKLLSGNFVNKQFQIGASSGETIEISLGSVDPSQLSDDTLGTLADIDVTTEDGAQAAIEMNDIALAYVNEQRSRLGSTHNMLESTINNLTNANINTLAAESTIRDLDFAEESMNLNRIQLLTQARTFAQAQANSSVKNIVDILG